MFSPVNDHKNRSLCDVIRPKKIQQCIYYLQSRHSPGNTLPVSKTYQLLALHINKGFEHYVTLGIKKIPTRSLTFELSILVKRPFPEFHTANVILTSRQ